MSSIVFDVETVGENWESLTEAEQSYLLKYSKSEEEREAEKSKLSFYPLTGKIISIAMYNPESKKGKVFYEGEPGYKSEVDSEGFEFQTGDEAFILNEFWHTITKYQSFVTFNGRSFDGPYIMMRSMINRIKPTRNLIPNRFGIEHIDLMDTLTFYGATRKFSLDFYCRRLGIESPKSEDASGDQVGKLYESGKLKEIAEYNKKDTIATAHLYELYKDFLHLK